MDNLDLLNTSIAENQNDFDSMLPLYYQFKYNDLPFDCQIVHHENKQSYILNLTAKIGYLPYSAENQPLREKIINNLSNLIRLGVIVMDHHCNMTFPIKTIIKDEINANKLMETITYTLLDVQEVLTIILETMQVSKITSQKYRT
ncbi:MAG: hypothetical protein HOH19_11510 [Kordiimonadaceae bacterium]|jgi:hypothetical protein|nr:hypothetical protein [Kordiimonadaceae bacterium]MBT6033197.1 hypothetical protein [Kordiimonadaceae bacterium]